MRSLLYALYLFILKDWNNLISQQLFVSDPNLSDIENKLLNLKFGYETEVKTASPPNLSPRALCQPTRPRGCDPLLNDYSDGFLLPKLPCIKDGTCPFIQFRCSRGHEWKASPGTPVCFYCPMCKKQRNIIGQPRSTRVRRRRSIAIFLASDVYNKISGRGGSLLTPNISAWESKVLIRCKEGHEWYARVKNLLGSNSWCPKCSKINRKLSESSLQETARYFGGKFLGFSSIDSFDKKDMGYGFFESSPPPEDNSPMLIRSIASTIKKTNSYSLFPTNVDFPNPNYYIHPMNISRRSNNTKYFWICAIGHKFQQSPNNIRRHYLKKRRCSWCPICTKNGIKFIWDPSYDRMPDLDQLFTNGIHKS